MSTHKQIDGLKPDQYTLDQQGLRARFWRYNFWLISILSLSVIIASVWFIDKNNNTAYIQKKRTEVQNQLSIIRARLEGNLNSNIQAVNGLVSAISAEPNMVQERFELFAEPLMTKDHQLRNIAGAPNMVIRLIHPLAGNEAALGLDYLKNEKQGPAAVIARDTGQLVLAGPVNLVQGGRGFIGRVPVYSENITPGKRKFWGLLSAVIDVDKLYEASGLVDSPLNIAIFGQDKRFSDGSIFYGDKSIFTQRPVVGFIELPFGNWQLAALPKEGWPSLADDAWQLRLIMFIISLCILTPVISLTWLSNQHRDQQIRLNALFQLSPLGIALNDFTTGQYLNVNQRFSEDSGYNLKQLQKLSYWDLTPEKYNQGELDQLEDLSNKGFYGPYEKEYKDSQGNLYPVLLNGILIKDSQGRKFIWSYIQNISAQKHAEKKLSENSKQFELVINATKVGIWDWQVQTGDLTINDRWAEIIGYTIEELGNINIDTWLTRIHSDDSTTLNKKLQAHWKGKKESYIFEGRMRHKSGHDIWVLDTGKVIEWNKDGEPVRMVGTRLDVTNKKHSEQKLAQINDSLETQVKLIEAIADVQNNFIHNSNFKDALQKLLKNIIHITGSELAFIGNVHYKNNQAYIKMFAFNYADITSIGQELIENIKFEGMEFTNPDNLFVQAVNSQTPLFLNHPELKENGLELPNFHPEIKKFIGIPIVQNENCIAIIGMANRPQDYDMDLVNWLSPLTNTIGQLIERMDVIEEKRKTEKQLIEAKNEAEAAGRAKTEFLATMSHEIRTPMNGVLGMLTLLQKSELSQDQLRKINIAKISAESLLSIINDILDFTKVESGKLELESIKFNIRETIDSICQSMGLRTQEKDIELIVDLSGLTHNWIISDPVRIRQILTNLIGNASKFTNQGEVIVRANILQKNEQRFLHCEIQDTGVGIAESKIKQLFSSFTQADASTTRKFGGTGLGLSICKRICGLMQGQIWVESKEGVGSQFNFEIPISLASSDEDPLPNTGSFNILLVHSNEKLNQALSNQLGTWGHSVTTATHIAQVMDLLTKKANIDLILINSILGDTSGLELGRLIRQQYPEHPPRLILMTTINQLESDASISEAGFNGHFPKPIITQDLFMCFNVLNNHPHNVIETKQEKGTPVKLPASLKILLVEDIIFNQEVATMLLAEMGAEANVANNGQEAVDMLNRAIENKQYYDVVLMDCQMPIMDGFDATRAIREIEKTSNHRTCIIAMTANAMSSDRDKCLNAGMDDYLTKPIDESKLLQTLLKWSTT